jgi:putative phage-type endonuclease
MKTLKYENREEWLAARRGKITGTRLKDIVVKRGTGRKLGFYELIAERLAIEPDSEENPMDRGHRLEEEAIERFKEETGKKVDTTLKILQRDDNPNMAYSPDGTIGKKADVEVKCLSSARHIEALLTQKVPDEYEFQVLQGFIVNDDLETRYIVFYDPRIPMKDYFVIEVKRADVAQQIEEYLAYERAVLQEVNDIVVQLSF